MAVAVAAAGPTDRAASGGSPPLPEVPVVASRLDRHPLDRAAIHFVQSHAGVSPVIQQMGRWRAKLCPRVTGLRPAAAVFVTNHLEQVARSVGAPAPAIGGKCAVNVEIVFTSESQELLDHVAKAYPVLLGSARSAGDTTFRRPVQSWYLTGTRSLEGVHAPADQADATLLLAFINDPATISQFETADPAYGPAHPPPGLAGSRLSHGLASDLLHVFIIVETDRVAGRPLRSIADYLAMLALTRMGSLDTCSELPSIIDLLSSGCGGRQPPVALTDADTAYLKALYSANVTANLNIEQGDMRDRMVKWITSR